MINFLLCTTMTRVSVHPRFSPSLWTSVHLLLTTSGMETMKTTTLKKMKSCPFTSENCNVPLDHVDFTIFLVVYSLLVALHCIARLVQSNAVRQLVKQAYYVSFFKLVQVVHSFMRQLTIQWDCNEAQSKRQIVLGTRTLVSDTWYASSQLRVVVSVYRNHPVEGCVGVSPTNCNER